MIQVTVEYVLRPGAEEKFEQALSRMQERVKGFDGYLGEELCPSTAEDGKFVTIFYWRDRETMATWRQDPEHLKVQPTGPGRNLRVVQDSCSGSRTRIRLR